MTTNFNTINTPVINPTDHAASDTNEIDNLSANNKQHEHHHAADNNTDTHNQSLPDNEDHSEIHHHDHSSSHNSMPMMSQGSVMYMDGFHSALFHNSQTPPPCLNFFHPNWTLHTPTKFVFAMLCVTLMGMLVEACGVWRVRCLRKGRTHRRNQRLKRIRQWEEHQQQQRQQVPNLQGQELQYRRSRMLQREVSELSVVSENGEEEEVPMIVDEDCPRPIRRIWRIIPPFIRKICNKRVSGLDKQGYPKWIRIYDFGAASLHSFRAWLGYLLMLTVMSYAVEFMFSAVFGMVIGRFWFVDMDAGGGDGGGVLGGAVGVGGGIGGVGLGEGGGASAVRDQGVAMNAHAYDGTWGGGGDPCCGIDEHDDDDDNEQPLREPLLGSENNGALLTRRHAFDP